MGCGSSVECTSPKCQNESSNLRCYKHGHNYSWYCKYCKIENEQEERRKEAERKDRERRLIEAELRSYGVY